MGDLNTVHVEDLPVCDASPASQNRHTVRGVELNFLFLKWKLLWHSSVSARYRQDVEGSDGNQHFTHISKTAKRGRVLDYMMMAAPAHGHQGSLSYTVHPELAVLSDHWPLVGTFGWETPEFIRPRRSCRRPRLRPILDVQLTNRFAALMEERTPANPTIEHFSECIFTCHKEATIECGPPVSKDDHGRRISELSATTKQRLADTDCNHEKTQILKAASMEKKALVKQKLTSGFIRSALSLPRQD